MILTTTPFVEDEKIGQYLGLVTGFNDSGLIEDAIQDMENAAKLLDADAVIGVRVSTFGTLNRNDTVRCFVDVVGTAVKLK